MPQQTLRSLPSIDQLLHRESLQTLIAEKGRDAVRERIIETIAEFRSRS